MAVAAEAEAEAEAEAATGWQAELEQACTASPHVLEKSLTSRLRFFL
jgi:hypothetical protein